MSLIKWFKSLFNEKNEKAEIEEKKEAHTVVLSSYNIAEAEKINTYYTSIFRPWFDIFKKEKVPASMRHNKYIDLFLFNIYYRNVKSVDTPDLDCDNMRFASDQYIDYLICDAIGMNHIELRAKVVKSVEDVRLFAEFLDFANKMMVYKNNGEDSDIYSESKGDSTWIKVVKEDYRLAYIFTIEKPKDKGDLEAFLDETDDKYDYFVNFFIRRDFGDKEETKFRLVRNHFSTEYYPDEILYNRMEEEFFYACSSVFRSILKNSIGKYILYKPETIKVEMPIYKHGEI